MTSKALRIAGGGGKRSRDTDDQANGSQIPDMSLVQIETTSADSQVIKDIMAFGIDVKKWITEMPTAQHVQLQEIMVSNSKYIVSDSTLRKYASMLPEMEKLEAHRTHTLTSLEQQQAVPTLGSGVTLGAFHLDASNLRVGIFQP